MYITRDQYINGERGTAVDRDLLIFIRGVPWKATDRGLRGPVLRHEYIARTWVGDRPFGEPLALIRGPGSYWAKFRNSRYGCFDRTGPWARRPRARSSSTGGRRRGKTVAYRILSTVALALGVGGAIMLALWGFPPALVSNPHRDVMVTSRGPESDRKADRWDSSRLWLARVGLLLVLLGFLVQGVLIWAL
jgi:hypothetical protein